MGNPLSLNSNHQQAIRFSFVALTVLMFTVIVVGSFTLGQSPYFTGSYLLKNLEYVRYKVSFVDQMTGSAVAHLFQITPADRQEKAQSVPVLLYHGVVDEPDGSNVTKAAFQDQMFALKKAGYTSITIEELYNFLHGHAPLPDKSILITFDDGRKDSYYNGDPVLKAVGYNAVMFAISKFSARQGDSYYLSLNELKQMVTTGRWNIQSHGDQAHLFQLLDAKGSTGHFLSNKLWIIPERRWETDDEFKIRVHKDLLVSKEEFERKLGLPIISFAFPFGDFGQQTVNFPKAREHLLEATKSVYPLAFYQLWPSNGFTHNYPGQDTFMIKRFDVRHYLSGQDLLDILERGRIKLLPYQDTFTEDKGWFRTWGNFVINDGMLDITAKGEAKGSSVFLDGSGQWTDYAFSAQIASMKGNSALLVARYRDDANSLACYFSSRYFRIEQVVNGTETVLAEVKRDTDFSLLHFKLGIKVQGNDVTCLLNDAPIVQTRATKADPSLAKGGIGFKTWDWERETSSLKIKEVTVQPLP